MASCARNARKVPLCFTKLTGAFRYEIAAALGMPERALAEAEQRAEAVAPPVIANAPAWLEDYWALAHGR
jgi:hypothetical protein